MRPANRVHVKPYDVTGGIDSLGARRPGDAARTGATRHVNRIVIDRLGSTAGSQHQQSGKGLRHANEHCRSELSEHRFDLLTYNSENSSRKLSWPGKISPVYRGNIL